ncbi:MULTISPECIES: isochorismatase family protein [Helicobacter]|uniref:Isochorismatase n=1 Tax=Helicobacter typhlonius TaxID=76936 RepID=A0A099UDB0_9HELI|nr:MULTISPECIES: isochorismatase family protein [Helicobacter]TLD78835.1 isochorismatase family protein [Helicobacter typhlonius]TLD90168.1 isochorismatase family protein [Helicobacter sp. MIT 03-1616]CUU40832.1 Isochorismatase [Helicobacter typhlonius]HCD73676.1 hydrolase [Helicobacter sp.]
MRSILKTKRTLFVCVDVQEKIIEHMAYKDKVIKNTNILLESATQLGIPTLVTEQYPKGLGKTHSTITIPKNARVLEKTSFGIFGDEKIASFIAQSKAKTLIFFGIETHICVLQSIIEARNLGYECLLAADACSSRDEQSHQLALNFFNTQGVVMLPTESILFRILGDCKHSSFKAISALIK